MLIIYLVPMKIKFLTDPVIDIKKQKLLYSDVFFNRFVALNFPICRSSVRVSTIIYKDTS